LPHSSVPAGRGSQSCRWGTPCSLLHTRVS
jgi:hypothetical protein